MNIPAIHHMLCSTEKVESEYCRPHSVGRSTAPENQESLSIGNQDCYSPSYTSVTKVTLPKLHPCVLYKSWASTSRHP